jgi:hypothetical protein
MYKFQKKPLNTTKNVQLRQQAENSPPAPMGREGKVNFSLNITTEKVMRARNLGTFPNSTLKRAS